MSEVNLRVAQEKHGMKDKMFPVEAIRNLEGVGMPREEAEAVVEFGIQVSEHMLSRDDLKEELDRRNFVTLKYFNEELDRRNYITREDLNEELDRRNFVTLEYFKEELDRRNYITREDLKKELNEELDRRDFVTHKDLTKEFEKFEEKLGKRFNRAVSLLMLVVAVITAAGAFFG